MERTCPECSARFRATRDWQLFCSRDHATGFSRIQIARGKLREPFTQTALRLRPKTAEERELRAWARSQIDALEAKFRQEDRAAGRRPELVVAARMASGWSVADLEMRAVEGPRTSQGVRVADGADLRMEVTTILAS